MANNIVLSTDMSAKGFQELVRQLKQVEKNLENYQRRTLTLSLREVKKIARRNVTSRVGQTGYEPTGLLEESFYTERVGKNMGLILNTHLNAAAVEFGTGIPGATSAHPVAGERGYYYGDREFWFYADENGRWWTEGQTGKRFMYDALIEFKETRLKDITLQAWQETMNKGVK